MSERRDPVLDAADQIANGREVDWAGLEAADPQQAVRLANLRKIARIPHRFSRAAPGPAEGGARDAPRPLFEWGHLEVLERLGEGQSGEVYRAFDPILRREVALKLRKESHDSQFSARAYIEEARHLARVRHPNVLAVHGADVHDGRIGIWADLVEGRTLEDRLRDGASLPVEEALHIALQVARALAAVGASRLVHGDVKGSNVMLAGNGAVILTDFGAGIDLEGHDGPSLVRGTPLSMAPELFRGEAPSPASDAYALGVLLHRMLAGSYPITADTYDELVARHSAGRRDPAAGAPVIRANGLRSRLLARLVLRLLDPDPAARPSAEETADRLVWIQQSPQRRRRRVAVASVIVSLALGTTVASIGLVLAKSSASRAETSAAAARAAAAEAEAIDAFLLDMLSSPQPIESGRLVKVTDVLDDAAERVDDAFSGNPTLAARMMVRLAETYFQLNQFDHAASLLERAISVLAAAGKEGGPLGLKARLALARCLTETGSLDDGAEMIELALPAIDALAPDDRLRVLARIYRARVARERDDVVEVGRWLEQALELRPAEAFPASEERHLALLDLGENLVKLGEYREAEEVLRPVLSWYEATRGDRYLNTLIARRLLAQTLDRQGRYPEAEPLMRTNVEVAGGWLGSDDDLTLMALSDLSNNLYSQGRLEESTELDARLLELHREKLGLEHASTLAVMGNYAIRLRDSGRTGEAEALTREALRRAVDLLGESHQLAMIQRFNLAELLLLDERPDDALAVAEELRPLLVSNVGERHHFTLVTDALIGASLAALGRLDAAELLLRQCLDRQREILGPSHPNTLEAQVYLARVLRARGGDVEARALLEDALERRRRTLGESHPQTGQAAAELASWPETSRAS